MNERLLDFGATIVAIIVAGVVGSLIGRELERKKLQNEAIQRGFAHYNPTNAVFEWKQAK